MNTRKRSNTDGAARDASPVGADRANRLSNASRIEAADADERLPREENGDVRSTR